jgi:hypothetical protein
MGFPFEKRERQGDAQCKPKVGAMECDLGTNPVRWPACRHAGYCGPFAGIGLNDIHAMDRCYHAVGWHPAISPSSCKAAASIHRRRDSAGMVRGFRTRGSDCDTTRVGASMT